MRYLPPVLAVALLSPAALPAQTLTDQFVEISVSDTVPMTVTSITYQITVVDPAQVEYDENTDYEKVQREQNERLEKAVARMKKDLQAEQFVLSDLPVYGDPYTVSSYPTDETGVNSTVLVTLKSTTELDRLVRWLRQRGHVDGSVVNWEYARKEAGQALVRALFEQARAQAQQLAELGDRKLGKLLSVQDPDQRPMTFQDFLSAISEREGRSGRNDLERLRMRSLVFRFALLDR